MNKSKESIDKRALEFRVEIENFNFRLLFEKSNP